jgi:hypothetical protein
LWWAIAGQLIIAGLLLRTGIAYFNREELLGRELDNLNLGWSWSFFWREFKAGASSVSAWYRHVFRVTLRKTALPALIMALILIAGARLGAAQADIFKLPAQALDWNNLEEGFVQGAEVLESFRFFSVGGVGAVWGHNLRAIVLATLMGLFTFGVLGVLVLALPFVLIGYFAATAANIGIPVMTFITAFVLPHGIFEIPAIILAGGALLRVGATLSTPAGGRTMSEALLESLADWLKIIVALVLPMLLIAAILEIFVTPRVAILLMGS